MTTPSEASLARAAAVAGTEPAKPLPRVRWQKLYEDVLIPERGTALSAGYDLRAYLSGSPVQFSHGNEDYLGPPYPRSANFDIQLEPWTKTRVRVALEPGQRVIIPTGLRVELPEGWVMDVRPRSGTSFKKGLEVVNAPGTIDPDYRGEVGVILKNGGVEPVTIEHGERIAQVLFFRVEHPEFTETDALNETERSLGGFGSTGVT